MFIRERKMSLSAPIQKICRRKIRILYSGLYTAWRRKQEKCLRKNLRQMISGNISRAVEEGKVYDLDGELFGMSADFDYPKALDELQTLFYGEGE